HQRRLSTFEHPVSDNLKTHADHDQNRGDRPHAGGTGIIHDGPCDRKQYDGNAYDGRSNAGVEKTPVDQNRQGHDAGSGDPAPKRVKTPQSQRDNRSQKQKQDAKYMHRTVARIAVIFHVIHKLALEISSHATLASILAHRHGLKLRIKYRAERWFARSRQEQTSIEVELVGTPKSN